MHPKTRYRHAAVAALMLAALGYCLGWHGEEYGIAWRTPEDVPLIDWVRLGPTRPSWFPISFQVLERKGSNNKLHWDIGVRVDHPGKTRFYPHYRVGDTIKRTEYKIIDVFHRSEDHPGDGTEGNRSSIIIQDDKETIELFLRQPRRDNGGGLVHCFVFFPRTPVRGLSSGYWVKSGGILNLNHLGRREQYKVLGESVADLRLQRIEEGDPVGDPVRIPAYDEAEHIQWRRKYCPGHP